MYTRLLHKHASIQLPSKFQAWDAETVNWYVSYFLEITDAWHYSSVVFVCVR